MGESTDSIATVEEDRELVCRGLRAHRKRTLTELFLLLCGLFILIGFGMAHISGIHGPLDHPGIILGVVGILGALIAGFSWLSKSPHWFVEEVLGEAAEHELKSNPGS